MLYQNLSDIEKKNTIEELYVKQKLSFGDIANKLNTYANKIRRDAKKFHIRIRDKSEAQSNAIKTGKHKHPTKGTERPETVKDKIGKSVMKSWDNLNDQELEKRKNKAKNLWNQLSEEEKQHRLSLANQAVRVSSKNGSKLESHILSALLKNGYKTDFHKEHILSNTKLQIDLFLPTMNIAIEVDGPSHFLPVWGEDVLLKNQKYDKKKTGLIIGKGLSLIRIKQTRDFSKSRADLIVIKLLAAIESAKNNKDNYIEIGDE